MTSLLKGKSFFLAERYHCTDDAWGMKLSNFYKNVEELEVNALMERPRMIISTISIAMRSVSARAIVRCSPQKEWQHIFGNSLIVVGVRRGGWW